MSVQDTPFTPAPPPAAPAEPGPSGIGGWLILPLIGFIGTIALTGWSLAQAFSTWDGLVAIFTATAEPLTTIRVPTILSLLGGVLVIASAAGCLYLIFTRRYAIKNFATAHYVILAAAGLIDLWGTGIIEKAFPSEPPDQTITRDAIRGVLIAFIWIPYFHLSKRVRNTFTVGAPARADGGVTMP